MAVKQCQNTCHFNAVRSKLCCGAGVGVFDRNRTVY